MNWFLAFLNALPAIQKLVAAVVEAFVAYEKKQQKENFKKAIEDAILKGDQRGLDSGLPSGHSGVKVEHDEKQ